MIVHKFAFFTLPCFSLFPTPFSSFFLTLPVHHIIFFPHPNIFPFSLHGVSPSHMRNLRRHSPYGPCFLMDYVYYQLILPHLRNHTGFTNATFSRVAFCDKYTRGINKREEMRVDNLRSWSEILDTCH